MNKNILITLKNALISSVNQSGKSLDDIYSMFYRWDVNGTGMITSAQFLRALDRMHINLNDDDQDFLVEILDSEGMGKINYEGLLESCFTRLVFDSNTGTGSSMVGEESEGASMSGVSFNGSLEGQLPELRSSSGKNNNNNNNNKKNRPHTASSSRPQSINLALDSIDNESFTLTSSPLKSRRPLTAAPRLLQQEHEKDYYRNIKKKQDKIEDYIAVDPFVIEINDNDEAINNNLLTPFTELNSLDFGTYNSHLEGNVDAAQDFESFNENTLVSDQDEYIMNSPRDRQPTYSILNDQLLSKDTPLSTTISKINEYNASTIENAAFKKDIGYTYENYRDVNDVQTEPKDHLMLLATQSLTTLREMVLARYCTGKSLLDIFHHFDRNNKLYFDAKDLVIGLADIRLETSEKVADLMISILGIDGHEKVSFGEFSVFVTDPEHAELEKNVQQQLAEQLERQGRDYQVYLYNSFCGKIEKDRNNGNSNNNSNNNNQSGMVSISTFKYSLEKIGLKLTSSDTERLVIRFNIHGQSQCSVTRFLRMVQNSSHWRHAEKVLLLKEEAFEEAQIALAQLKEGTCKIKGLTEDIIKTAEYLGIRVLSEPSLLWIASDAFVAPLPNGWVTHRDTENRLFFYNSSTNTSQWDHPLDDHFRKLRDKHR
jgi:Ca2+-binding EF-hand superfamily protein